MESKIEGSKMRTKSQEKAIRAKNIDVIKPSKAKGRALDKAKK